jgi:hypothetical protein
MEELRQRQGPVARGLPAVDRDVPGPAAARAGMNQAGRSSPAERTVVSSYGRPRASGMTRAGSRRG